MLFLIAAYEVSATPALCWTTDGVVIHQADVHSLDIDTFCSCRLPEEFAEIGTSLCGELTSYTTGCDYCDILVINLTGCHGNGTYLREDVIIIFAVLVIANGRHGNHTLSLSMSKEECCSF